jgi:hypothetical protein
MVTAPPDCGTLSATPSRDRPHESYQRYRRLPAATRCRCWRRYPPTRRDRIRRGPGRRLLPDGAGPLHVRHGRHGDAPVPRLAIGRARHDRFPCPRWFPRHPGYVGEPEQGAIGNLGLLDLRRLPLRTRVQRHHDARHRGGLRAFPRAPLHLGLGRSSRTCDPHGAGGHGRDAILSRVPDAPAAAGAAGRQAAGDQLARLRGALSPPGWRTARGRRPHPAPRDGSDAAADRGEGRGRLLHRRDRRRDLRGFRPQRRLRHRTGSRGLSRGRGRAGDRNLSRIPDRIEPSAGLGRRADRNAEHPGELRSRGRACRQRCAFRPRRARDGRSA